MKNNLKRYPIYLVCLHFIAWMPVFFLYFNETISLKEVILLEAIYYIFVVILEVPSGYFSDVVGRKKTLIISAISLCFACIFYISASSFLVLAFGQICFAGWMAFQSGTTTVFLFETLKDNNQESEYGNKEAYFNKIAMYGAGFAALLGGILGSYNLIFPYFLTLIASVIAIVTSLNFTEPKKEVEENAEPFIKQLTNTVKYLRLEPIGWVFAYLIVIYVLAHVPYEFYQPYLKLLENKDLLSNMKAPFLSGLIYCFTMFVGAYASGISMKVSEKVGLKTLMLSSLFLMLLVIALLGFFLHPILIGIILFRNLPRAIIKAPVNAFITPKIEAGKRATFHSLISLAGRLGFFACLFGLSFLVPKDQLTDWNTISQLFLYCFAFGVIFTIPIVLFSANKLNKKKR